MSIPAASGYSSLQASPLARIGYYDKIINRAYEADYLPVITCTNIDQRLVTCNQIVQFQLQPDVGPWRKHEMNQGGIVDSVVPDSFSMEICNAADKWLKFDKMDIMRICERWAEFEKGFLESAWQNLAILWRQFVLNGIMLEANNKGATAGPDCSVNLGSQSAPIIINCTNSGTLGCNALVGALAAAKIVLKKRHRWMAGQMFMVAPPEMETALLASPYANALQMGSCVDCSMLVDGQVPGVVVGFDLILTNEAPAQIDPGTGRPAYFIVFGWCEAYAFAGDIIESIVKDMPNLSFGQVYGMLAVWGGKAILPDALGVLYVEFA